MKAAPASVASSSPRAFDAASKMIGMICHAGWIPISAKVMQGRTVTSTHGRDQNQLCTSVFSCAAAGTTMVTEPPRRNMVLRFHTTTSAAATRSR